MKITDKQFWFYALERAAKTFLQVCLVMIPASSTLFNVDWVGIFGVAGLTALMSLATSLVFALPEHQAQEDISKLKERLEYWEKKSEPEEGRKE